MHWFLGDVKSKLGQQGVELLMCKALSKYSSVSVEALVMSLNVCPDYNRFFAGHYDIKPALGIPIRSMLQRNVTQSDEHLI